MSTEPRIINMRDYGNKCPEWAFRIDRATPFGNPFKIGTGYGTETIHMTRVDVCNQHRDWLNYSSEGVVVAKRFLKEYAGQPVACWCAPKQCHGTNYLEIYDEANEQPN